MMGVERDRERECVCVCGCGGYRGREADRRIEAQADSSGIDSRPYNEPLKNEYAPVLRRATDGRE